MTIYRIASLARGARTVYAVHSDYQDLWQACYRSSGQPLATWLGEYDSCGDGMIQHGPEHPVLACNAADALASLAAAALAPDGGPLLAAIAKEWPHGEARNKLDFFAGLRPGTDAKPRYYCAEEQKSSTADSKRHDRRWEMVPEWADGSTLHTYQLACKGHDYLIDRWALYRECYDRDPGAGRPAEEALGIASGWEDVNMAGGAWNALASAVAAHRARWNAERSLDCYQGNVARAAERRAREAEEAAAAKAAAAA